MVLINIQFKIKSTEGNTDGVDEGYRAVGVRQIK